MSDALRRLACWSVLALSIAAPLHAQTAASATKTLAVGPAGLSLYPRWSRAFKPLAQLATGQQLNVLRSVGDWHEVSVSGGTQKGWVFAELSAPVASGGQLKLPIAASPTTSGLVVKGWSPGEWAAARGSDPAAVVGLLARKLDGDAYARFLAEDPVAVSGPPEPEPSASGPGSTAGGGAAAGRGDDLVSQLHAQRDRMLARNQLASEGLLDVLSPDDERVLGTGVVARVLSDARLHPDDSLSRYVGLVGQRLADHLPGDFVFAVLDDDTVNAFSAPGGFVFVTRGAVDACDNEAQLAALLAHELCHLTERHAVRSLDRNRHRLVKDDALAALEEQTGSRNDSRLSALVDDLSSIEDDLLARLDKGYAHVLEHQADALSVDLLRRAGYDPRQALLLLQKLAASSAGGRRLPSHPDPDERIVALKKQRGPMLVKSSGSLNAARLVAARSGR